MLEFKFDGDVFRHSMDAANHSLTANEASVADGNETIVDLMVWPSGAADPRAEVIVQMWGNEIALRPDRFSVGLLGSTLVRVGTPRPATVDIAEIVADRRVPKSSGCRLAWSLGCILLGFTRLCSSAF